MIGRLTGIVSKLDPGDVLVDVHGVAYRVSVPLSTWETLPENEETAVWISTYVREDRLDLFGFADKETHTLFEALLGRQGIGPKMALEFTGVPRALLQQALEADDSGVLTSIKGVGKKSAEKLLIELKAIAEKYPSMFIVAHAHGTSPAGTLDRDAVAALTQLGFAQAEIMRALRELPADVRTTEERVTAALRSL